ncbi:hypothetical protein A8B75_19655 [Sphingomonadales bacterium EhC05]|nr:hypothetical protein A8B75_19655 [Sphingomonadales bacterium EhC05]
MSKESDSSNRAIQVGATAGANVVGRDLVNINEASSLRDQNVKSLVLQLEQEIQDDQTKSQWIENLEFFNIDHIVDEIEGLEAKLDHAGRQKNIKLAMRHKEMFAKFLAKFSLYESAQILISKCLHEIHQGFEANVHPECEELSIAKIDKIIYNDVVSPIVSQYGFGAFSLDHGLVSGMTYWLADRCYVRWHS